MPVSARGVKLFCFLFLLIAGQEAFSATPEEKDRLESALRRDVEFLSDSLCAGRKTGSAGACAAAFYIIHRLEYTGYDVAVNSFETPSGAVGRNLVAGSFSRHKAAVLIMAYYDGLGKIGSRLYPGADSNASGVAALLSLAESLKGRSDVIFALVDGHNANMAGAEALKNALSGQRLKMIVNLDILGSTLAPPDKFWKNYLIVLGGAPYQQRFDRINSDRALHLYYDYYGSRSFTDLFYRKVSDHKVFFDRGVPVLMFTSGITLNTNREGDTFESLDYSVFADRVDLISRLLQAL